MDWLITYEPEHPKIRIGREGDGGYVIVDEGDVYDAFLTCGIADETSFEEGFPFKGPSWAFDGTIPDRPKNMPEHISFVRKNIGTENSDTVTNMHDIAKNYKNIFLKMDIEGHEWRWINTSDLSPFRQIVIELHGIWGGFGDQSPMEKIEAVRKLATTHHLVHVHGNNCVGMQPGGPPWVGEFTYIRKDVPIKGLNTTPLPLKGIDFPNNPGNPEHNISYWPFVSHLTTTSVNI